GDLARDEELARAVQEHLETQRENGDGGNGRRGNSERQRREPQPIPVDARRLAAKTAVHRIHLTMEGREASQRFVVYGCDAEQPAADVAQWQKIADVDPTRLGS